MVILDALHDIGQYSRVCFLVKGYLVLGTCVYSGIPGYLPDQVWYTSTREFTLLKICLRMVLVCAQVQREDRVAGVFCTTKRPSERGRSRLSAFVRVCCFAVFACVGGVVVLSTIRTLLYNRYDSSQVRWMKTATTVHDGRYCLYHSGYCCHDSNYCSYDSRGRGRSSDGAHPLSTVVYSGSVCQGGRFFFGQPFCVFAQSTAAVECEASAGGGAGLLRFFFCCASLDGTTSTVSANK